MGLYNSYKQAMEENDVTAYLSLLHDDLQWYSINLETHFQKRSGRPWLLA